jgi:hypothetical protein
MLRQKEIHGNSNISPCKNIIFKKSYKTNQNPSRYYNFITNLKFTTQAKRSSFKNPHIKIDLLPRAKISKANILYIEPKHNIIQKFSYKKRLITWGPKSLKLLYSILNLNTISLPTKARPTKHQAKGKRKEREDPPSLRT